ncbi:porin family protein [Hymenobacter convexus]|uniref:porin family protein n=1 Tax=Hymenobacter sp. CA1UV-4 TaxID=3063782 RepID=UPI0027135757|nr:porin family protein [Hymenobacter sp. CA1UV-4]MDO7854017.1 porin family protein [Hymenobacter sp. CA1UV-4]
MFKTLLSLGALLSLAGAACGQTIRYGLKAGVSLARQTDFDVTGMRNKVGATAGLMADAMLSEKLSLHPELLFSQKGQRFEGSGPGGYTYSYVFRSNYLDLPVLLRLKLSSFFAEAGPQAGYLLSAKGTETRSSSSIPTPVSTTYSSTEGLRRLDVGFVVGVGYQLRERWELGARYNGGILGTNSYNTTQRRNSVFQFQAGYLFGGE